MGGSFNSMMGGERSIVDETKLNRFIGHMLSDLGGAASIALVRIGDALGLYKILHAKGPMTAEHLSAEKVSMNDTTASGCPNRQLQLAFLRSDNGEIRIAVGTSHGFCDRGQSRLYDRRV
jgi:hypothetical protein